MGGTMRSLIAAGVVAALAGIAMAAGEDEIFTFPGRNGEVKFNHTMHQDAVGDCAPCHEGEPGKIPGFSKRFGHWEGGGLCKSCHENMKAGPSTCSGCHDKKKGRR